MRVFDYFTLQQWETKSISRINLKYIHVRVAGKGSETESKKLKHNKSWEYGHVMYGKISKILRLLKSVLIVMNGWINKWIDIWIPERK
jgi:hypothetical protein